MNTPDPNAASMRRLEGDLAGALALLSQAAEELERHAPMDTPGWQVALEINAFVDRHWAPGTWLRTKATTQATDFYRGC